MASLFQFVDSIATSPTVRLDLNSAASGLKVAAEGVDFSPPPLRRAGSSSMQTEGENVTAAVAGNRTLKLPIVVRAATATLAATALGSLALELARSRNILRVQLAGMTAPVFFRTYAAPDYTLGTLRQLLKANAAVMLEIIAEPYALGLSEVLGPFTVNNDPANGTNGCYVDVTGVDGDVETPIRLELSGGGTNMSPVLAVRRHRTPPNVTPFVQAESMTQGTDTTTGSDSLMSNGSRSRCTFATVATMATRLTGTFPSGGTASVDRRGLYRIFLMCASSAGSTVYAVRMKVDSAVGSTTLLTGDTVTYTATDTSRRLLDLGLLQIPLGQDPVNDGYGPERPISPMSVQFQAQRVSGTASLDLDFAAMAYADEEQLQMGTVFTGAGTYDMVLDGTSGRAWVPVVTTGDIHAYGSPSVPSAGFVPRLTPGQTNRLMILRPDGVGTGYVRGPDTKTRTTAVRITYWPRYLTVAP